jgi:predicted metal-dependent RNase
VALRKQEFDDNEEQSNKTTKRPRITIDVSPELRRRIKIAASQNDLSISEYIGKILDEAVPEETSITEQWQPLPPDFMKQVYQVREQVMQDSKGELFEDSTELIRQMREERSRELEQL